MQMCVKYRGISKIGMCEMYTIQLNLEMPHKSIKKNPRIKHFVNY